MKFGFFLTLSTGIGPDKIGRHAKSSHLLTAGNLAKFRITGYIADKLRAI